MFTLPPPEPPPPALYALPPDEPFDDIVPELVRFSAYIVNNPPVPFPALPL